MEEDYDNDYLWNVHSYLNEYMRHADVKAELIIAWTSGITTVLIADKFQQRFDDSFSGIVCAAGFVLLVMGFVVAFMVVRQRLRTSKKNGFIFWRDVLNHGSKDGFTASLLSRHTDDLRKELAEHIYDLSAIAECKYNLVNKSLILSVFGSAICGVMYVFG